MNPKKRPLILFFLFLAAGALRLNGLDWGLPSKTLSLTTYHPDEAYLFQMFEHIHKNRSLHPGPVGLLYGTFYFYLVGFLIFLAKFFGILALGSREFLLQNLPNVDRMYLIARSFSVLCGIASVVAIYFLGKKIKDESCGIWSSFFLGFCPIAIAISHYAKVDALLPLLVIGLLWFSLDLLEKAEFKHLFWSGFFAGLLASTKYNAGIFVLTPLLSLIWSPAENKLRAVLVIAGASLFGFLLTTPYAILDLPLFLSCLKQQFGMLGGGGVWEAGYPSGFWRYLTFYFPFGLGWLFWGLTLCGIGYSLSRKNPKDILLLSGFLIYFTLIGRAGHRLTAFLAALLPFASIFAAFALETIARHPFLTRVRVLIFSLILVLHVLYGFAFARLYSGPDPREQAEEWFSRNISTQKTVGIARSYFWTPGLFRQKGSPYPLQKGGDDLTGFDKSVLGLA
ncbi:MAG: glycosyltransferase family 39 protein, partial [Elusimicrobia bacterium]|nr:glycosyltransferase family 39 protein [Elusimicrobiota bacterium]